jgi:Rad3-related DNA helicase
VSDSDPPGFEIIDVQVGNVVKGEEISTYELVETVHDVVVETFEDHLFKLGPVDAIVITIFDQTHGIYNVGIDFETARKYHFGEISEESYFEDWSYPDYAPRIQPP